MIPVVLADVQTKFNPRKVPGLIDWFQADLGFTLSDGDPIATWFDQSSNGNDVKQSTEAKKPLWKENIVNGRPVVRFDGADDFLISDIFSSVLTQPNYVFVVSYVKDAESDQFNLVDGLNVSNRHVINAEYNASPDSLNVYAGTNFSLAVDFPKDVWHIHSILFDGASSEYWLDSASQGTGDAGSQDLTGLTVGSKYDGTILLEGDLYAVLVYDGNIGATNRGKVEKYLGQRVAITL